MKIQLRESALKSYPFLKGVDINTVFNCEFNSINDVEIDVDSLISYGACKLINCRSLQVCISFEHYTVLTLDDDTKDDELSTLEARNVELLEALKKAHEILLHEMDNGRTPSMLKGVGLGYFEDVICGVNHD